MMSGRRVLKSVQAVLAHGLLFCFTLLLVLKLDRPLHYSWWVVFVPLWLFHVVVARGRFSLPAPSVPHDRHWSPFHAIVATPLLVAFELLLCIHLDGTYAVNLKIVFFPLLALEIAILVDNVRMCRALMPGDEDSMSDEAIWETLPHFWVAIAMVFFIAATTFTLLKICGDVAALGWWDLFINYGVAECFAFIICTKWYNPAIHGHSNRHSSSLRAPSSSTTSMQYLNWNSGFLASLDEDDRQRGICSLQDIGGHVMKIPLVCFQLLLFMRLAGTPPSARLIPIPVLFIPLFLLQGAGILFSIYRLVETINLPVDGEAGVRNYFRMSAVIRDFFSFMRHGSRLLGWWSIDEGSREEQARLYYAGTSGYNTFAPDTVKQMPKAKLAEEIWRLQAALCEQSEITQTKQDEFERLQNEKILCRICFEEQINILLLPCRHHILCSTCCDKCKRCPICRVFIEERLPVNDV
ncbi:uncharacterized protein LOC132641830 isoform X1 [Lycium barbarum]|uniref:uncharacterized protein LOC132641830 isoform X1 n=1 Tax=Lycium barbarum TaxID=112863 RepID=UPI00293F50F7|nr:uncharacterized protein LOC132641830 isoform X1 [Lycium barbarum]